MKIEVDLDNLTIGDLPMLDRASQGDLPMADLVEMLDRVVVGGAKDLPLTAMGEIVSQMKAAVDEMANPEVGGKN